jgi:signal transduction histidine kinase
VNLDASEAPVRFLMVLYGGCVLMNALLSIALWLRDRTPLQRSLVLVWATTLFGIVVNVAFTSRSHDPIGMTIPFWFAFPMSLAMADLLTRVLRAKPSWTSYVIFFSTSALLSLALAAAGLPFWIVALPSAAGVSIPVFHAFWLVVARPTQSTTPILKATAVSCLLAGMHNLDYPFLRNRPEMTPVGFTIALLVVFAISITAPAVILERTAEDRARIDEVNKMKSRFFANISHELRTPLTLILAPVEQLLADARATPARPLLETTRRNALRLQRHIDELLDLARLDAGGLRLNVASVDLGALAASIWESAMPLARQKKIDFVLDASAATTNVHGDAHRLDSIMTNLVSNALKYTLAGGRIVMSVRDAVDHATVEVSDDGPGMSSADQARIFERFYRIDTEVDRRIEGAGIGLALAKELAELHGGTLTVKSVPGKGAAFTLKLPKGRGHFGPEIVERRRSFEPAKMIGRRFDDILPAVSANGTHVSTRAMESRSASVTPASDRRARVLIVEDLQEMRAFLHSLLDAEFDVVDAENGDAGLRLVVDERPDIVVTDIMMPGRSGVDLCRTIKTNPKLANIPVILLTAQVGSEATLGGFAHGADDFVTKPFHPQVLLARMHAQLRLRALSLRLVSQEKFTAVGTLAAGVAHEVRNPLNAMMNAARLLDKEQIDPVARRQLAQVVAEGTQRVAEIVDALDAHVRPAESGEVAPCSVRDGVESTLLLLQHRLSDVSVRREYLTKRRAVIPAAALNQALMNLLDNALRSGAKNIHVGVADTNGQVRVRVSDDGSGVPTAIMDRIFDPFFTTREPGEGRGLGLFLSKKTLNDHGGDVRLVSRSAPGAVFEILLPMDA